MLRDDILALGWTKDGPDFRDNRLVAKLTTNYAGGGKSKTTLQVYNLTYRMNVFFGYCSNIEDFKSIMRLLDNT